MAKNKHNKDSRSTQKNNKPAASAAPKPAVAASSAPPVSSAPAGLRPPEQGGHHGSGHHRESVPTPKANPPRSTWTWLGPMLAGGGAVLFLFVGVPMIGSLFMSPKDKAPTSISSAPSSPSTASQPSAAKPAPSTAPNASGPAPERGLVAMLPKDDASKFGSDTELANAFFAARAELTGGKAPALVRNSLDALMPKAANNPGREHVLAALAFVSLRSRDINAAATHIDTLLKDFPQTGYGELARAMQVEVALQRATPATKNAPADIPALDAVIQQAQSTVAASSSVDAKAYASMLVAQAQDLQGKKDESIQSYLEVAKVYPNTAQAATSLVRAGTMLQKKGQVEPAREALRKLVAEYPNDAAAKEGRKYLRELELIGQQAPDLAVLSWPAGEAKNISELRGKVVLVNFWQTWCPHCRNELPHLSEMYNRYKDKGLVILGVSRDDKQQNEQQLLDFLAKETISFPIVRVEQSSARDYAVTGIPAAALVDKQGKVVWRAHPASLTDAQIEELLAQN